MHSGLKPSLILMLAVAVVSGQTFAGTLIAPSFELDAIQLSLYGSYILDKEFEDGSWDADIEGYDLIFRGEYCFHERFSLYAELGLAIIDEVEIGGSSYDPDLDPGPMIGFGGKVLVYEVKDIDSKIYVDSRIQWFTNSGEDTYFGEKTEYDTTYTEFQVAGMFSYLGVEALNAYGGILFNLLSEMEEDWETSYSGYHESGSQSYDADSFFGIYAGASYQIDEMWSIFGELHAIDETSLTFGGTIKL